MLGIENLISGDRFLKIRQSIKVTNHLGVVDKGEKDEALWKSEYCCKQNATMLPQAAESMGVPSTACLGVEKPNPTS